MRKTRSKIVVLALTMVMVLGATLSTSAESYEENGSCYFNGKKIVSTFSSESVNDMIRNLEPGDEATFEVEFENRYKETTHWYMKNEALETLEQSYDRTENGGYTYKLTHIGPDGEETVLFDNSKVGGVGEDGHSYAIDPKSSQASHGHENTGEGLHQATNATDEWFFIQTLDKGESGRTRLYVKFDGESEVNDYMDTAGELLVAYAVELDTDKPEKNHKHKKINTGDETNLLMYIATMLAAMLMLIFTIMSYRKDRRMAKAEAGAESAGERNVRKERE